MRIRVAGQANAGRGAGQDPDFTAPPHEGGARFCHAKQRSLREDADTIIARVRRQPPRGFTRARHERSLREKKGAPTPPVRECAAPASSWNSSAPTSSNSQPPIGRYARAIPSFLAPIRGDERRRFRSRRIRRLGGPAGFGLGWKTRPIAISRSS